MLTTEVIVARPAPPVTTGVNAYGGSPVAFVFQTE